MGNVARVPRLPFCDFCWTEDRIQRPARYDFRTRLRPWANGCIHHYELHRASSVLGTGHGQLLVVRGEELERGLR